jgi:hypothetical protein
MTAVIVTRRGASNYDHYFSKWMHCMADGAAVTKFSGWIELLNIFNQKISSQWKPSKLCDPKIKNQKLWFYKKNSTLSFWIFKNSKIFLKHWLYFFHEAKICPYITLFSELKNSN